MTWNLLLSYLKVLKKQKHCRLPFNIFSHSRVIKVWRLEKLLKKWCWGLGKNQSKLIKSATSCGGHLTPVDIWIYCSSVNTCQNQVKLCPLKVQDVVQLAIAKCCLSIKDCRSQASFNDFTIKGLGPKLLAKGPKFLVARGLPRDTDNNPDPLGNFARVSVSSFMSAFSHCFERFCYCLLRHNGIIQ